MFADTSLITFFTLFLLVASDSFTEAEALRKDFRERLIEVGKVSEPLVRV